MNRILLISVAVVGVALTTALGGCQRACADAAPPRVAAANAYLASAVWDVLGDETPVLYLAEPGMCPGHFDLRPSQIGALRNCLLLLRFEFQTSLDEKFVDLQRAGLTIAAIRVDEGQCIPPTYRKVCSSVAAALVSVGLIDRATADERLAALDKRIEVLGSWVRTKTGEVQLQGMPVLASKHQAAFARYLGLNVRATFAGTDTASAREIENALAQGRDIRLVIANLPEGRRLADALAERLGARVVVFGNFPDDRHGGRFEALFRDNVEQLCAAATP